MIGIINKLNRPFSRRPHCHITCGYRCNRTIYQGQVLFCVAEPFQWTSRHKSSTLFEWNRILTSITGNTNLSVLNGCCGKKIFWQGISKHRLTNLASLKLIINGNSNVCQCYVFRLSPEHLVGNFPKIGIAIHLEFRINWLHCAGRHHSTETEEQIVPTFRLCRLFCSFVLLCFWFSLKQLIWATQTL